MFITSYKKYKIKKFKNLILILKTQKFPVVLTYKYIIILHKLFHFIKNLIKIILIKWLQVLKLNQWQGL